MLGSAMRKDSSSSGTVRPSPSSPGFVGVQILGLAGSNHVLSRGIEWLPGYTSSRLQTDLAHFSEAAQANLGEALFWLALVPGIAEELVFRGLLFAGLLYMLGSRWAIAGSAIAFGLVHLDPHHSLIAALLGLQLGALRHLGGLPLAIAAHVVNNALAVGVAYAAGAGIEVETSSFAGGLFFVSALVVAGIACAALAQRERSSRIAGSLHRTPLQTATPQDE